MVLTGDRGDPPLFFVSVASKGLTVSLSPLFATHTRVPASVASKGFAVHQDCAKRGLAVNVFILKGFKLLRINTCSIPISVDSKEAAGSRRGSASGAGRATVWRGRIARRARRKRAELTIPL